MVSQEILPIVAKQLGLSGTAIGAELYKLLLYEPGAHFQAAYRVSRPREARTHGRLTYEQY
jgi:hypothetical protein